MSHHIAVFFPPVKAVYSAVLVLRHLRAADYLEVILVIAYHIGIVAVGEAHQHHVLVIVGVGRITLFAVYAPQLVECLHNLIVLGVVFG